MWLETVSTVAPSVGALGTLGAATIAVLTYRRQVADRQLAQASLVRLRISPLGDGGSRMQVTNDSDQPVRAAALIRPLDYRPERSWRTVWLRRSRRRVTLKVASPIHMKRTLWPGETDNTDSRQPIDDFPFLYFTDATERRWLRDDQGNLREVGRIRVTSAD